MNQKQAETLRFAAAAEQLIGVPFRLHGRDAAVGLDCVGLVAAALIAIGREAQTPRGYPMRNRSIKALLHLAERNGFAETNTSIAVGDLLLCAPGPAQFHLVIAGSQSNTFIHAHAGLRAVVQSPGPLSWPPIKHWRLLDAEGE